MSSEKRQEVGPRPELYRVMDNEEEPQGKGQFAVPLFTPVPFLLPWELYTFCFCWVTVVPSDGYGLKNFPDHTKPYLTLPTYMANIPDLPTQYTHPPGLPSHQL